MASLQGRRFAPAGDATGTVLESFQDGDLIWARYAGGPIRLGHLTGTRHAQRLELRFAHVEVGGAAASGRCHATIDRLADGRLALDQEWERDDGGTARRSRLEEIPPPTVPGVLGLGFAATATLRREETVEFAERVLGLTRRAVPGVEADLFVLPDGSSFAVTSPRGIPGGRSVGFLVADLDAACERLRAAGVEVGPRHQNARDSYAHFTGPDGETYELVERRAR